MSPFAALADRETWPELAAALAHWLPERRWFQGKARTIEQVTVDDVAVLEGTPPVADVLVRVHYRRGEAERYQVPLVAGPGFTTVAGVPLADALADRDAPRTLASRALATAEACSVEGASVRGAPVTDELTLPGAVRPLRAEQSNSSVVFGETLLLKIFRKLETGINPDVELTRGLTQEGFRHVPPQAGALLLDGPGGPAALAVLSAFRHGARDAWDIARVELAEARAGGAPGPLEERADELGRVIGELHLALERRFGGAPVSSADVEAWMQDMHRQLDAVLETAQETGPDTAAFVALADTLRARFDRLRDIEDAGTAIRTHGDLHLGQVMLDPEHGWQVLDFEGEPARPLGERRLPHSPVRDVAGMLRSFDYAAAHGGEGEAAPPPAVAGWRDEARRRFLDAYVETCGSSGLLPRRAEIRTSLLDAFELDKAVYELGYELANRPGWVRIPLGGILRLAAPGPDETLQE